jgi:protein-ribulosamine 3-kinase
MISLLSEDIITHLTNNFPGSLNIIDCYPISGGCINRACKLKTNQGNFFIKWNTSGPKDMFLREAESLIEMRKSVNEYIVVLEPLLAKTIDNTPGCLISFLENRKVENDDVLLGRGLATLHKMTENKFGFNKNQALEIMIHYL